MVGVMSEPGLDLMWLLDDSDRTEDNLRLLDLVERATPEELDGAFDVLSAGASRGSSAAVHLFAMGLARAGRIDEAIPVFRAAIAGAPDRLEFWLNLAVAYVRVGQVDLAAATLDSAMAAAESGQVRMAGADSDRVCAAVQRRRDELAEWISWRHNELRLIQLRASMLRERVAAGEATTDDRIQLVNTLMILRQVAGSDETLAEAGALLESVHLVEPHNVEALERLVYIYASTNDDRLDGMLRELEGVAANSSVLRAFAVSRQDTAEHIETMRTRATSLFELAIARGPEAEAALVELRQLVRCVPSNRDYRGFLMFAEHVNGNVARAMALAELQDGEVDLSHAEHFNVAQVFWQQDEARGRRHLSAAYEKASTDEERRDVEEMLANLSQPL